MKRLGGAFLCHRIWTALAASALRVTDVALFALAVLTGGLGTSWYMVEAGSPLTTVSSGPWVMWPMAGRPDADPYTRAHFARTGSLPVPAGVALTYLARTDNSGENLYSSCDYRVEVRPPAGAWWSLAVFDASGHLIVNTAERHAFTSETAAISPDGRVIATMSRSAAPGNWLPTGGAGRLTALYTVTPIGVSGPAVADNRSPDDVLPVITQKGCR